MNNLLLLILFAAVQNIDNFVVAAAYRLKNIYIGVKSNLLIGALSAAATGAALLASHLLLRQSLQFGLEQGTEILGRGILLMLGIWTLVGFFRTILFRQIETEGIGSQNLLGPSKPAAAIAYREALTVGIALAIDNVGPSFALGLIDRLEGSALTLTFLVGFFSVLAVSQGQLLGNSCYAKFLQFRSPILRPDLISGLLFVIIAILPLDGDDLIADLLK